MPHIVNDNCASCRYTECVSVCPVDCFHGSESRLYIDPEVCIDCAACVPICPVHAIADAFDCGELGDALVELNRRMSAGLPVIDERTEALPTAAAKRASLGY